MIGRHAPLSCRPGRRGHLLIEAVDDYEQLAGLVCPESRHDGCPELCSDLRANARTQQGVR
jgi:hypothetical protein